MNGKLGKILSISIVTMLLLSVIVPVLMANGPNEEHDADAMWLEPSSVTATNVGDLFNITVWVNMSVASYSWQVMVLYDIAHVNVTRIGYTGTGGSKSEFFDGLGTAPVSPLVEYNSIYGSWSALHGESLQGSIERAAGYGSLCWLHSWCGNQRQIP